MQWGSVEEARHKSYLQGESRAAQRETDQAAAKQTMFLQTGSLVINGVKQW